MAGLACAGTSRSTAAEGPEGRRSAAPPLTGGGVANWSALRSIAENVGGAAAEVEVEVGDDIAVYHQFLMGMTGTNRAQGLARLCAGKRQCRGLFFGINEAQLFWFAG